MRNHWKTALLALSMLAFAEAARADDAEPLRRRIETLERELREERERSARERRRQEERLRDLESRIEALREPAPAPAPVAAAPTSASILNPAIAVIGNVLFRGSDTKTFTEEGDRIDNRVNLRETEVDFRAAVDPYADAVTIVALESEAPGEFEVGVEEGYVNVKQLPFLEAPPLGLKLKLGRFRPELGRVNILHTHDLPQSLRPLVIEEFLGEEGFVGDGASGQMFLPWWDEDASLDLTLQATTGDVAIASGGRNDSGFLGHLRWFRSIADAHSLEIGGSGYYARNESPRLDSWIAAADVLYRWRPLRGGKFRSFLLGGEVFHAARELEEEGEDLADVERRRTNPTGFYAFAQVQPAARWYLGLRGDATETIDDDSAKRRGLTPYVSYYFSEFLRFRLNYEHLWSDLALEDGRNTVLLEANFLFGSHPPEPFWVNK